MFKAYNLESRQEVVILDPLWAGQLETLRSLDRRDALVCPGCLQPVRMRAGDARRRHFAHKHLGNCPYEQASPELLAGRAALYGWLVTKFEPDEVTIEKALPESDLPRPVDCWVEHDGLRFAYWVVTVRLSPDLRERITQSFERLNAHVTWIFHSGLMRPQAYHPNRLHLTTTERELIQRSDFDEPHQDRCPQPAGSLHYLDPERESWTTYRGLCRVHAPQLYRGLPLRSRLDELLASMQTGEPVHPGETQLVERYRLEALEQKRTIAHAQAALRQAAAAMQPADEHPARQAPPTERPAAVQPAAQPEVGRCIFCGQETSDWWYFNQATGECKCRACYRAGRA